MELIDIVKKWNFWEKEIYQGIPRKQYLSQLLPHMERKEVLILKGIRRSGKSTLLKQLMYALLERDIKKLQIVYINMEDYLLLDKLSLSLFDAILEAYRRYAKNKERTYFFIDEIQAVQGWEKWIRTMYDRGENIKFIITGSSSLMTKYSTLLTGRNLSFAVMPLSFREFTDFTSSTIESYVRYGGFPEVALEKSEDRKLLLLEQYLNDILSKDIIQRHSIRNAKQLIDIARYLISASGSKVSINKLSKVFGIAKDTISSYLSYMLDASLIVDIPFFSYSMKKKYDVTKLPKAYAADLGLITLVSESENRGQRFETAVLHKLLEKRKDISYWSDGKSEVDFITKNLAINVTATDDIPEREMKGFENFLKGHKGFTSLLITKSLSGKGKIPLINFLNSV